MKRMSWNGKVVLVVFFLLMGLAVVVKPVFAGQYRDFKVLIGMPFTYFDIEDTFGQRWVSTYLRGRPVIILTGHRYQRYEILKWAEMLKREFGLPGVAHLMWVVNLRKFPWSTSRNTVINQWRSFAPPVPLLMDWHGVIGRSLPINYGVPNIIALDAEGRLAMHEMHTFTPEVYHAVAARIRALVAVSPGMARPLVPVPGDPLLPTIGAPMPSGKKGYSN
jgi:hypothetical protein